MHKSNWKIKSVLFDLDGTLADTSQDMCDSLNRVLEKREYKKVDCKSLKKYISRGAIGIIEYASVVNGKSIDSSMLRSEFLEDYKNNCFHKTTLNENMEELLDYLLSRQIKIGIVTNKHSRYVNKIVDGLGLKNTLSCVVTGDMVLNGKPASDSLIKASELINCQADAIMYVGDDERDIIAGRNAGMITVAANFGFISEDTNVNSWQADIVINDPVSLKQYLIN